jgi:hypothetical protein
MSRQTRNYVTWRTPLERALRELEFYICNSWGPGDRERHKSLFQCLPRWTFVFCSRRNLRENIRESRSSCWTSSETRRRVHLHSHEANGASSHSHYCRHCWHWGQQSWQSAKFLDCNADVSDGILLFESVKVSQFKTHPPKIMHIPWVLISEFYGSGYPYG